MARMFLTSLSAVLALAGIAIGMPLDLMQQPPDIYVSNMTISYVDSTDTFTATGTPATYDPDGIPPQHTITGGTYSLTAIIDSLGAISSASLTITGTTTDKDNNPVSGTLLTAVGPPNLLFGFSPDANDPSQPWLPGPITEYPAKFEFTMSVSGGLLMQDFGGLGAPMGIIMVAGAGGFDGDFVGDFTISTNVSSDHFSMVPEPASMTIIAAGLLAMRVFRTRHKARRQARS